MKLAKRLAAGALILLTAMSISGCKAAGLYALPDEERYQYIHEVRDELKLSEIGQIVSEEYDDADGVFGQSFLRIKLKGEETFQKLSRNASDLEGASCHLRPTGSSYCSIGSEIEIRINEDSNSNSSLVTIYDYLNGKRNSSD